MDGLAVYQRRTAHRLRPHLAKLAHALNVALQVETLLRHPLVEKPHLRGELDVFGVFYDIPSATVLRVRATAIDSLELATLEPSGGW
jgi:carbonic anhydrase